MSLSYYAKVKKFLSDHSGQWYYLNISTTDGQLLYDLIIKGKYKSALENFKQAGLSEYIDARLADAHSLVKELN
jgi:hypothetical protein